MPIRHFTYFLALQDIPEPRSSRDLHVMFDPYTHLFRSAFCMEGRRIRKAPVHDASQGVLLERGVG